MASVSLGRYEIQEYDPPEVCMKCGAPSRVIVNKTFAWSPPWVIITILVGIPVYIILALVLTKRMAVRVPLCDKHKGHWTTRMLITLLGLLGILILVGFAIFASVSEADLSDLAGPLWGVVVGSLLVWLIVIAVLSQTAIRPTEITDRSITLRGVSEGYIEALREDRGDSYDDDARGGAGGAIDDDDDRPRKHRFPGLRGRGGRGATTEGQGPQGRRLRSEEIETGAKKTAKRSRATSDDADRVIPAGCGATPETPFTGKALTMPTVSLGRYEIQEYDPPEVCMKCGAPSRVIVHKSFSWTPPGVGALSVVGVLGFLPLALIFLIVSAAMTKRMAVRVPMCNKHKGHWTNRMLITLLGLLVVLGLVGFAIFASVSEGDLSDLAGPLWITVVGLLLVWLITIAILQQSAIRPTEITDRSITLRGVSEGYIEALREDRGDLDDEDEDRPRRSRRRDDDDDDRPRKHRRPEDEEDERHDRRPRTGARASSIRRNRNAVRKTVKRSRAMTSNKKTHDFERNLSCPRSVSVAMKLNGTIRRRSA